MYVPWRRYRALEAVAQACRHFTIDEQRVYATGGSGGGRISSQVGVLYADVFTGAFPLIGCDPYVPAPAGGGNRFYNGFWPNPDGTIVKRARNDNRYPLLTGSKDPNQFNTLCVFNLYKSLGFAHVTYYEVPDMGHQIPPADWFEKGLNDLDAPLGDPLPLYLSARIWKNSTSPARPTWPTPVRPLAAARNPSSPRRRKPPTRSTSSTRRKSHESPSS